jgi:hypothetical protein
MIKFTYSDELYSDLHKDAYGFRPSEFSNSLWSELSPADKQIEWDFLIVKMDERYKEEKLEEDRAIDRFEYWIDNTIESGAANRAQALQWILEGAVIEDPQLDIEHFEWKMGLPFGYIKAAI